MKFEELPRIPESWLEFLRGGMLFSPASRSVSALVAQADAARGRSAGLDALYRHLEQNGGPYFNRMVESLQKLRQPDCVVVLTNFYPALFGGPAFQLFKCITAIKLCEELSRHNLRAIPVCWISNETPRAFSRWSVRLLNGESELCLLEMEPRGPDDPLPRDAMATLLAGIEELGNGNYDWDTLEILRESFGAETTLAMASARLVADLMKEWELIVLSPHSFDFGKATSASLRSQDVSSEYVAQCSILPVMATVIDPFEVDSFAAAQPFFAEHKLAGPMAWPQASATVVDSRSHRILKRHGLDLSRLYAGADNVIGEIMDGAPRSAPEKLIKLKQEAETRIAALGSLDPASGTFAKAANSGREKIVYQLDRLRENYEAACRNREQMIGRQIRRVCNSLAPNGRIQEWEIGGIQLALKYSRTVLRSLYDKLDIMSFDHQLVSMD